MIMLHDRYLIMTMDERLCVELGIEIRKPVRAFYTHSKAQRVKDAGFQKGGGTNVIFSPFNGFGLE